MNTFKKTFLDYVIVNTGNGDGFVLMKEGATDYQCHLGNYATANDAKRYAIMFFMIARPQKFSRQIVNRIFGGSDNGCMLEYYTLESVLKDEGIPMPVEIVISDDMNGGIRFMEVK